jgi:hypothetical protein
MMRALPIHKDPPSSLAQASLATPLFAGPLQPDRLLQRIDQPAGAYLWPTGLPVHRFSPAPGPLTLEQPSSIPLHPHPTRRPHRGFDRAIGPFLMP